MIYDLISERKAPAYKVSSPKDVYEALKRYAGARTERFLAVLLNGAHDIISIRLLTVGLINRTLIHPTVVFYPAIVEGAVAVILSHNHPSKHLDPSAEDIECTRRLREAGEILGIPVLDHLIISRDGYLSFTEMGLLPPIHD